MVSFNEITLQEVLSRVSKCKKEGSSYKALCPAHDDHNPSLSITEKHGKVLLKCFSQNCSYKDIITALGLNYSNQNSYSNKITKTPPQLPSKSSKRKYKNLAEYAAFKGVASTVFIKAGWDDFDYYGHPSIKFITKNGNRYRLLDVEKGCFRGDKGFKNCWYKLDEALQIADSPLILCNGEPSTVVAQHFYLAAFCSSGGENVNISTDLLEELKELLNEDDCILIALDNDKAGRTGALKKLAQLKNAGFINVRALDFGSDKPDGYDLADFVKEHKENSLEQLLKLPDLVTEESKEITEDQEIEEIEEESSTYTNNRIRNSKGYYLEVDQWVKASDRDNYGQIKALIGNKASVHFFNKNGNARATVSLDIDELTPTNKPNHSINNKPLSNDLNLPKPLSNKALHGVLGEAIRIIAPHTETNIESILLTLLAMVGNIIGRKCYFEVEATKHYPILNVAVVGPTGSGKGSSLSQAEAFIEGIDPQWESNCLTSGLSSGEGLIYRVRDEVRIKTEVKDKETKEKKICEVLKDAGIEDKRLCVVESELSNLLQVIKREGNTLSGIIRNAFDAKTLESLSKNAPMKATNPHVSIIGHITKEELNALFSQNDKNNGLANRFAFVCAKRERYLPNGSNCNEIALEILREKVKEAIKYLSEYKPKDLTLLLNSVSNGGTKIDLDLEALDLLNDEYVNLCDSGNGQISKILARGRVFVRRIAMIYAVLDKSLVVKREHLEAALEVWRYCSESAQYIFDEIISDNNAVKVLNALKEHLELSRKYIADTVLCKNVKKVDLDQLRDSLINSNLITVEKRLVSKACKPTEFWKIIKSTIPPKNEDSDSPSYGFTQDFYGFTNSFDNNNNEHIIKNSKTVSKAVVRPFEEENLSSNEINSLDSKTVKTVKTVEGNLEKEKYKEILSSNTAESEIKDDNLEKAYGFNGFNGFTPKIENLTLITSDDSLREFNYTTAIVKEENLLLDHQENSNPSTQYLKENDLHKLLGQWLDFQRKLSPLNPTKIDKDIFGEGERLHQVFLQRKSHASSSNEFLPAFNAIQLELETFCKTHLIKEGI